MIKTVSVIKGRTTQLINLPKQMLEETGLKGEKQVQIENVGDKIIISRIKSSYKGDVNE